MRNFEDLGAKFGDLHPGLDLVAVVPVGIPLHIYDVDLTLYEAKEYPLLNEHVLRALELGLNSVKDVASFLGVDIDFVADAVAHEDSNVGTISIASNGNIRLTDFGRTKLENLTINEARRSTQKVHVDLITGDVTFYRKIESNVDRLTKTLDVLDGEEYVRRLDVVQKDQKQASDFTLDEIDALLTGSEKARKINVLEVLSSRRSSKKPFYSLGQILVFADASGERGMLNMTVDGERQPDHDRILALPNVRKALNITIDREPEAPAAGQVFQGVYATKSAAALELVRKLEELPEVEALVEPELEDDPKPSPSSLSKLNPLGPEIFRVQEKPVRLKVTDHPKLRREAVRFAKERLVIICPWVKRSATNQEFLALLDAAARRGVIIDIALGIGDDLSDSDEDALVKLADIAKRHSQNVNLHKWRSHEKVLLVDQSYIESSFNWLSFAGVNDWHYRRERGTLIVNREIADEVYSELLQAIQEERDDSWVF